MIDQTNENQIEKETNHLLLEHSIECFHHLLFQGKPLHSHHQVA